MSFDCASLANFIKEAERLDADKNKANKATETSDDIDKKIKHWTYCYLCKQDPCECSPKPRTTTAITSTTSEEPEWFVTLNRRLEVQTQKLQQLKTHFNTWFDVIDRRLKQSDRIIDILADRITAIEHFNKANRPQALDLSDNQLRLLVDYLNKRVCYLEEQHGDRLLRPHSTTTATATQPGVHETDAGHGDGAKQLVLPVEGPEAV